MQRGLKHCLTTPTFRTFQTLVGGFLAQPGLRTITGMLVGARLAGRCHHGRAHRFFAAARWQADQLGLAVCDLIVARLLDAARRAASAPRGATTGSSSVCWCACRLCPTGWCACRCWPGRGSPAAPATASSTWPASSSG
jgi:hypothetical protein